MSIQTELTRITNAKAAIKTAIEGKGITVPDGTLLDGMAALIESIEGGGAADGAGKIFYAEITPATSGEVLTLEVGEIGERIAAVIVSLKPDDHIGINKDYAVSYIAAINQSPMGLNLKACDLYNLVVYRSENSIKQNHTAGVKYRYSTPSGDKTYNAYTIWNSTSEKPRVKFYVTNGSESKYGLLVGTTYDIWVIKAG